MSAKVFLPGALILAVLGPASARAQMNPMPPGAPTTPMTPMGEPASAVPDDAAKDDAKKDNAKNPLPNIVTPPPTPSQTVGWISPWIAYSRPDCCDTTYSTGPILSEYYYRTGISMPVATGILHESLQAGWINSVGGRSLFFNKGCTAAWTADVGLSYTYNNGNKGGLLFDQRVNFNRLVQNPDNPGQLINQFGQVDVPVSIRGYHRASVNLGLGREWYLLQPANCAGRHWRIGFDTGGRYGASQVELNDYGQIVDTDDLINDENARIDHRRLYDVFGAWFVSAHTDVEIPFNCCCAFIGGFRAEWNYNWSDAFSGQKGDLQDVNLMLSFGIRY